jgi:hypothetical protein
MDEVRVMPRADIPNRRAEVAAIALNGDAP